MCIQSGRYLWLCAASFNTSAMVHVLYDAKTALLHSGSDAVQGMQNLSLLLFPETRMQHKACALQALGTYSGFKVKFSFAFSVCVCVCVCVCVHACVCVCVCCVCVCVCVCTVHVMCGLFLSVL